MRGKGFLKLAASFLLGLCMLSAAVAEVKLPAIISSNMVLQRGIALPVWGWAEPGEMVAVTCAGQSVATKAGKDGRWQVALKELQPGPPRQMVVTGSSGSKITLKNILVGEVWVCSGQSNMEWPLARTRNAKEEIAAAKYPNIRLFHVGRARAEEPQSDCKGQWKPCAPEATAGFSAVGYLFGRHLHKELQVPVGLIESAWGGTPAEFWTSRKVLESEPALKSLVARGSVLYNGMIAPLIPYAIRGAIWYQGESNVARAYQYRTLFPAMIRNWRSDWGQGDFPFGFVQLAPFRYGRQDPACCAELWEAQLLTLRSVPNTGMAVTTDISNVRNIHPANKQDVGKRLGLWAMATVYGKKDLVYSGPIYKSMKVEGEKIRVEFDHVGGGLASRDDKPLSHFTIAGEDRKFVPAAAEIDGETIVVHSDQVSKPVAVRFAWIDTAEPNLMNKEGLPASPFRTDKFKGVTEGR